MKKPTASNCRLCGEARALCNSHVVPEFMYTSLYDDKHRFTTATFSEKAVAWGQKGLRERLLCEECETELSVAEKHVSEAVIPQITGWARAERGDRLLLTGLNYQLVRLCYLSILWRMSESSVPFFQHVDLGPRALHLRTMVRTGEVGEPWDFGFLCLAPILGGQFMEPWMLEPVPARFATAGRLYRVVMGGLLYGFYVSRHEVPRLKLPCFIQKNGDWLILRKDAEDMPYLARTVAAIDAVARAHPERLGGGRPRNRA